ncbi:hypothetical protein [Sphingobium yanoikuyae]|uniref:Uncharacterized protein n=1 Tax=Sphingobium yanoikuyae TaxID=13690 RepID=A0A3G2UMN2_SPHYA|nr:hypothetical protein [Sphingobium yanoikuyae]AYO76420.1 hypothetical protein EBF16_05365 [Sphingobium yanoikuyae]
MIGLPRIRLVAVIAAGVVIVALLAALLLTRATLADERGKFELWKTAVAHAQAEAKADALDQKAKQEAKDAKAAQSAQSDYDALRERYARLVRAQTAGHSSRGADLPRSADHASLPAEGAEDSDLPVGTGDGIPFGTILISQGDALICAENTAYAQGAYGWATQINQPASSPDNDY